MMSLFVGYPLMLASGYPNSKFAIRFSPTYKHYNHKLCCFSIFESMTTFKGLSSISKGLMKVYYNTVWLTFYHLKTRRNNCTNIRYD